MNLAHLRAALAALAAAAAAALLASGCASTPAESIVESLDAKTAVTVVALAEPLLFTSTLGSPSQPDDVAVGPFQINRMGEKSWYLWANRLGGPGADASLARLRIVSGGETLLELEPLAADARLPVSTAPYRSLADWATQAYYRLSTDDLARLQGRPFAVELPSARDGHWIRYESWEPRRAGAIDELVARQLSGRVAGR